MLFRILIDDLLFQNPDRPSDVIRAIEGRV